MRLKLTAGGAPVCPGGTDDARVKTLVEFGGGVATIRTDVRVDRRDSEMETLIESGLALRIDVGESVAALSVR